MMRISGDQLQNELLSISHHVDDITQSLREGDIGYAMEGLKDIKEGVERLSKFLTDPQAAEIDRMAESIDPLP